MLMDSKIKYGLAVMVLVVLALSLYSVTAKEIKYTTDDFFPELIFNKAYFDHGVAIYRFKNPTDYKTSLSLGANLRHEIIEINGSETNNIEYFILENVTRETETSRTVRHIKDCWGMNNKTETLMLYDCSEYETIKELVNITTEEFVPITKSYYLPDQKEYIIKIVAHWDGGLGLQSREWIPEFEINGEKYKQYKWAWWNTSYNYRMEIISNATTSLVIPVNGTSGICGHIIWTQNATAGETIYVYYDVSGICGSSIIAIANETSEKCWINESDATSGNCQTSVFDEQVVLAFLFGETGTIQTSYDADQKTGAFKNTGKVHSTGYYGSSALFDGNSDCMTVGDHDDFDLHNNFTIKYQMYSNDSAVANSNPFERTSYGANDYGTQWTGGVAGSYPYQSFILYSTTHDYGYALYQSTHSNFHELMFVYNGSYSTVYVDGVQNISVMTNGSVGSASTNLSIGARTCTTAWYQGYMDSVIVYNYSHTLAQVTDHYNNRLPSARTLGAEEPAPDVAPTVSLNYPSDNSLNNSLTITHGFTPADNNALKNCTLWNNLTSWSAKHSNASALSNGSVNKIEETYSSDAYYLWNVECCDYNDNCTFGASNYTFRIDTTEPLVSIISPTNTTYPESTASLLLSWNINEDASAVMYSLNGYDNVTLHGNGEIDREDTYSCTADWCSNGVDENWATSSTIPSVANHTEYENTTVPQNISNLNWVFRIYTESNDLFLLYCWNYSANSWVFLRSEDTATVIKTFVAPIPLGCNATNPLQIMSISDPDVFQSMRYYEGMANFTGSYSNITMLPLVSGSNNVSVWGNDTAGNSNATMLYFYINTAPETPTVDFNEYSPIVGDLIDVNATSTDADGDTVTLYYKYEDLNGTTLRDWSANNTYHLGDTLEDHTLNITAYATDGTDNSSVNSSTLYVTFLNITHPLENDWFIGTNITFTFNLSVTGSLHCYDMVNTTVSDLGNLTDGIQNYTRLVSLGYHTFTVYCISNNNSALNYSKNVSFVNYFSVWNVSLYLENDWTTPFNVSNASSVELVIYCNDTSETRTNFTTFALINVTSTCNVSTLMVVVNYPTDSYLREIIPPYATLQNISVYMVDAYETTLYMVPLVMSDYQYYTSRLTLYKVVGGTNYVIYDGYFDVEHEFLTYLIKDNRYIMRLTQDGAVREIGYLQVSQAETRYISISQLSLIPDVSLISDSLQMGAEMDNTTSTIQATYYDALNLTTSVTFLLYNLTNQTPMYNSTVSGSNNITFTVNGINTSWVYSARFIVNHEVLGNSPVEFTIPVGVFSGLGLGMANWFYATFGFIIMLFASFTITPKTRLAGLVLMTTLSAILFMVGWSQHAFAVAGVSVIGIILLISGIIYEIKRRGME